MGDAAPDSGSQQRQGGGHARTQAPALLIIPYFGTFGPWFPLYLHSLARQRALDLLLVTDAPSPPLPPNARRVEMTFADVRDLATARLATRVCLPTVRKLCDLKPAYGLVFEEYTSGYPYWAFGDEDVLYGDLDRLLAPHLQGTDLVTPSRTMTVGHLTLVRNRWRTNRLALQDPGYRAVLASEEHWAYDESGWGRPGSDVSFTRAVKEAEGQGDFTVRWGFPKRGDVPWPGRSYTYDGSTIRDNDGTEITYYHWGRFRRCGYAFPTPDRAQAGFAFDRYGFRAPDLGWVRRAVRGVVGRASEKARNVRRASAVVAAGGRRSPDTAPSR